jgi:hypothetical protein
MLREWQIADSKGGRHHTDRRGVAFRSTCSSALRRLKLCAGITFGNTRRPGLFAGSPAGPGFNTPSVQESTGIAFWPFITQTANHTSPRASRLSKRHICHDSWRRNARASKRRGMRRPSDWAGIRLVTNHFSTSAICFSTSSVSRCPRSPFPPVPPPNIFIRTEKKIGVNNTPKKVTPIIPANTAVPSA